VGRVSASAATRTLVVANLRFWPTVAPVMWHELARWRTAAEQIGEQELRALALEKLSGEAFNAEVAATLATLAPRHARTRTVRAIVALEVLFDYLDGRTEDLAGASDPAAQALGLLEALPRSLVCDADAWQPFMGDADGRYLAALGCCVAEHVAELPSFPVVRETALAAARRCAQAQSRLHAAALIGDRQLEEWAREHCADSGLQWREYIGGCASSVLAIHALIAAAAKRTLTLAEAQATDAAYLATGALITMLDSVVDEAKDTSVGHAGYVRLFAAGERAGAARALAREALARASRAPDGAHHAMTLAGVIAYYTTHPGARHGPARPVVRAVRRALSATIWPTLAVMRSWRAAKAAREGLARLPRHLKPGGERRAGQA
jgi:tetraprenyl-beta-curcumene synthase